MRLVSSASPRFHARTLGKTLACAGTAAVVFLSATSGGCAQHRLRSEKETQNLRNAVELSARLLDIADYTTSVFDQELTRAYYDGVPEDQYSALMRARNGPVSTVRALALSADPGEALVDLYVYVRLARWACENRAAARTDILQLHCAHTFGRVQERIDAVAEELLDPKQRAQIDGLVETYKQEHPGQLSIGLMRLTELADFSGSRARVLDAASPDMLSPVTDAARQLEQARLLGGQLVWLFSRMPGAIGWEASSALRGTIESPQAKAFLERTQRMGEGLASAREAMDTLGNRVDALAASTSDLSTGIGGLKGEVHDLESARRLLHEAMIFIGALAFLAVIAVAIAGVAIARAMRHRAAHIAAAGGAPGPGR